MFHFVQVNILFLIDSDIKPYLFDVNSVGYLYVVMVKYVLSKQSSINVNTMEIFLQNKFLSLIIWQTNYYSDQLPSIPAIIILIHALIDAINGYFKSCLAKNDLSTIIPSAASMINNNSSNIQRVSIGDDW